MHKKWRVFGYLVMSHNIKRDKFLDCLITNLSEDIADFTDIKFVS